MIRIFKHLELKEWSFIFLGFGFIVAQIWLDLRLPEFMSEITKLVQTPGSAISDIWIQGGFMMLCAFGSLSTAIIIGYIAAKVGASFSKKLRSETFNKVDSFSAGEITKFSTPSLITRSTNDITQVQMLVTMGLQIMIKAPILATWAFIKIAGKGFEWSVATGIAAGSILLLFTIIVIFVMPKFKKSQTLTDSINRVVRENLTGLPVVRAYNAENFQSEKFEKTNKELTNTQLYISWFMSIVSPFIGLVMMGITLSIYVIGAVTINQAVGPERLDLFSNMVVFTSYAMQIIFAFMMIAMMFIFVPRAAVSAKRIMEVLNTKPSITDGEITEGKDGHSGSVEFKNVSFRYPDASEDVLTDISFSVKKGETLAIIGSTGSGKSSLINLLPRFYDVSAGEILIDGVNIREYKLSALHDKLGFIPQKAVLFSGTVSSNVAFGMKQDYEINEGEIKKAVKIAQSKSFVEKMEKTYETPISRGGTNVSGGQKQRLSIARAVARDPEIFVFDDSFSALDFKTDRALRTALKNEMNEATRIIVAQRIGTVLDADQIIVLDEGKIVGKGTHKQLLKSCNVYKEIARSQLSEEELKS